MWMVTIMLHLNPNDPDDQLIIIVKDKYFWENIIWSIFLAKSSVLQKVFS